MAEMFYSEMVQKVSRILEETVNWTPIYGQQAVLQSWDQNCQRGRIQCIYFFVFEINFKKIAKYLLTKKKLIGKKKF